MIMPVGDTNRTGIVSHLSLDGTWTLTYLPEGQAPVTLEEARTSPHASTLPAQVPGTIETALQAAGLIDDPFYDRNSFDLWRFESYEWWYQKSFAVPPDFVADRYALTFHGLDTLATIWLNGAEIGRTDNMLIPHVFDVTAMLERDGENELVVRISSAVNAARRYHYPPLIGTGEHRSESLYMRKAAHMYGWDIAPRIVSAGIWRSVELEAVPATRIESLYLWTDGIGERESRLGFQVSIQTPDLTLDDLVLRFRGQCGDHQLEHRVALEFISDEGVIPIPGARLWWPRGYGEQNLYTVRAELWCNGELRDSRTERIGLRALRLDRTEQGGPGGCFVFSVNSVPIQITGTNSVPLDMLHSRDADRYDRVIDLAADLNCRMVRCWGGNVYEDQRFFDLCDERGILVWQDFSFACARYPQDAAFAARVEDEARTIIGLLRNHPSLALWCGDNECDDVWTAAGVLPENNRLTREILPRVVLYHDPHRQYVPSSPYMSPQVAQTRNLDLMPEQHLWGPRDYFKSDFYRLNTAHFIGEMGYHGCPAPESLGRFLPPENLWPRDNPSWRAHAVDHWRHRLREYNRNELMVNQVREFFGQIPSDLASFSLASQIVQAEALKFFIEHTRARWPVCSGILWWNLIDGWPQISDAVVDYYFRRKLAYSYIRVAQQPLLLLVGEPADWKAPLIASNVGREERRGSYRITDAETGEICLADVFRVAANAVAQLGTFPVSRGSHRLLLIEYQSELGEGRNHYLLGAPPFSFDRYRTDWLRHIVGGDH